MPSFPTSGLISPAVQALFLFIFIKLSLLGVTPLHVLWLSVYRHSGVTSKRWL